jgi:Cyclic nucleotide-binding domain
VTNFRQSFVPRGIQRNPKSFLAELGEGRSIGEYRKDQIVFSQGDPANAVFDIQKGKMKITVVSEQGREAVVAILGTNEFFGEGCLAAQARRIASVAALTESVIMRLALGREIGGAFERARDTGGDGRARTALRGRRCNRDWRLELELLVLALTGCNAAGRLETVHSQGPLMRYETALDDWQKPE